MKDPDVYRVIESEGSAETKVKGSRFAGFAFPSDSVDRAESVVEALRKKHYDATHVCFAWRVGHGDDERRRAVDAGEPYGTAGTPIMQVLERAEISDGLIAIVRWFGGTKLGTGGLIRAYGECARLALEESRVGTRVRRKPLQVRFTYPQTNAVLRLAEKHAALQEESEYGEEIHIRFAVPASRVARFRDDLIEATAGNLRFID